MAIPRKPNQNTGANVDSFIKGASTQTVTPTNGKKTGRRVISLSLMNDDASWVDSIVQAVNEQTSRKITRSEVISSAISVFQEKKITEIMEIIKNR